MSEMEIRSEPRSGIRPGRPEAAAVVWDWREAERRSASPAGVRAALQRLFAATGRAVGRALTWLFLVPLFYGFFLPFGWALRRGRRDRLCRRFEPDAASYWEPHAGPKAGSASHRRQY